MTITVKLHSIAGGQRSLIGERALQMRRVTVGRGADCGIPLEDPKKYISRVHLQLDEEGDECLLTVVSKVNPVFVNSQRQTPGARVTLRPGDRIELGEYEIEFLSLGPRAEAFLAPPPPSPPPRAEPEPPAPPPRASARAAPRADDPLIQMLKSASLVQEQAHKDIDYAKAIDAAQRAAAEAERQAPPFAPEELPPPEDIFGNAFAEAGAPPAAPTLDELPPPEDIFGEAPAAAPPAAKAKPTVAKEAAFGEATFVGKPAPPEDLFDAGALPGAPTLDELPPPEDIFGEAPAAAPPAAKAKPPAAEQAAFGEATFVGKPAPPEDLFNEPTMIGRGSAAEAKKAPPKEDEQVFEEATFLGKSTPPAGIFDQPTFVPETPATAKKPAEAEPKRTPEPAAETTHPQPAPLGPFDEPTFIPETPGAIPAPEPRATPEPVAAMPAAQPSPEIFDEPTFVPGEAPVAKPAEIVPPALAPAPALEKIAAPAPGEIVPGRDAGIERALQIFLAGAGIPPPKLADAQLETYLRECGAILRAAVEGIMALLLARAAARKEFQAEDRTMVASRDNNPLKLMSDPQEAIAFLFDAGERSGGFLNPVQAIGDACEDLRAHEIALIAGMRAAIIGAIRRFDPQALEKELEKAGGSGFSIGGKKSKLWDLFVATQEKLLRDAEDDFNKAFGRDFMGTYMAQIRKLRPPGKA